MGIFYLLLCGIIQKGLPLILALWDISGSPEIGSTASVVSTRKQETYCSGRCYCENMFTITIQSHKLTINRLICGRNSNIIFKTVGKCIEFTVVAVFSTSFGKRHRCHQEKQSNEPSFVYIHPILYMQK